MCYRSFLLFLSVFLLFACASRPSVDSSSQVQLKTPTKEIIITIGDLNKNYDILGSVECTITGKSMYSTASSGVSQEIENEAKTMLKSVAFTKYGEKVDAIINTKISGGHSGGFWGAIGGAYGGRTGVATANGIAISFK